MLPNTTRGVILDNTREKRESHPLEHKKRERHMTRRSTCVYSQENIKHEEKKRETHD